MSASVTIPAELSDQDYRKLISKALTKVGIVTRANDMRAAVALLLHQKNAVSLFCMWS